MKTAIMLTFLVATIGLAGCFGGTEEFDPNRDFEETGNTVRIKMTVVDLTATEISPGFKANMWAFCAEASNPDDSYSVNAIEHFPPLEGDAPNLPEEMREKCSVPGPTIRVKQGDRVIVDFTHSHFHPHTIHWHGQFVDWEHDGAPGVTQDSIQAGDSITYDFIAKRAGTLWYHCHVDTQLHVMQGLYGAFIVEPQDDTYEPKDIDQDYTWVLSTLNRELVEAIPGQSVHNHTGSCASGFQGCMNPEWDVTPDTWMVNGHSYPLTMKDNKSLIRVEEGERIRIRLINAGETFETIHPHGHDMLVTHRDGNPLPPEARFWVDTLTIGPAERYDVVMEMDNPGPWMMHTHVASHETNCGRSNGGMHSMILYEGYEGHGFASSLPAVCPYEPPFFVADDFSRTVRLSLPSNTESSADTQLPIEQICSLRSARIAWSLDTATTVNNLASELVVSINNPDGELVAQFDLGGGVSDGQWVIEDEGLRDMMVGDYNVTVSGRAVEASVIVTLEADYYEDLSQTKRNHVSFQMDLCPGLQA